MKKYLICTLIMLCTSGAGITAQSPDWEFSERIKNTTIEELKAHPEDFNNVEREEIFLWKANSYFGSDIDSAFIIYEAMIAFGKQNKDKYVEGVAYSGIGELHKMMGDFQKSKGYLLSALPLMEPYPNGRSNVLLGLAQDYLMLNKLDSAELIIDECLSYTYAYCDSAFLSNPHLVKGEILVHREKYISALDQYFKALEYSDLLLPMKKANTYREMSDIYSLIDDREKAMEYSNKALTIAEEHGYKRTTSMLHSKIGAYHRANGDFDSAIHHFEKSLPYEEEKAIPNRLINLYSQLVLTYLKLNDNERASSNFRMAETLVDKVKNDRDKSIFYLASGYYYLKSGRFHDSRLSFNTVVETGRQASTPTRMINGYKGLVEVNKKQGNWSDAFRYRDSLGLAAAEMNVKSQKRLIYDLESKYEARLKEEEILRLKYEKQIQEQEIKKKNRVILFSTGSLLLAFLAFLGFYRVYRIKTKTNKLLEFKNAELASALVTNKMLVKEIHHRVKNNLQVVSSLLNLQGRFEKDETILDAINSGKNRVQTMSILHQNLYANENLKNIKVKKYFLELADSLTQGYPLEGQKVNLITEIDDIELDVDKVVPLGLITNELITNALKYAYANNKENCELLLMLKQAGDEIELRVSDNGMGLPFDKIPQRPKSMGMQLIQSFSKKLKAHVDINTQNGTEFILRFNVV